MSVHAFEVTVKVVVSDTAADDDTLLDKMASELENQLERLDEIMSMKFGNDFSHLDTWIE